MRSSEVDLTLSGVDLSAPGVDIEPSAVDIESPRASTGPAPAVTGRVEGVIERPPVGIAWAHAVMARATVGTGRSRTAIWRASPVPGSLKSSISQARSDLGRAVTASAWA